MGQKVHPTGIRLGVVKDHNSVWYADSKTYAQNLINDLEVREYILKKLDAASVSRVKIERPAQTARITIFTARPGIVIGKKGEDVDGLRKDLSPPRWVCRCTSILKRFASPTWMRAWLRKTWPSSLSAE